jgi:dCMP deaminase
MSWDQRWMSLAQHVAQWSKDRSRKIGCVIVDDRQVLVSLGWNGFPRGINDDIGYRHAKPGKYLWTEHAERNAIFNAAAKGVSTFGCTIYLPWFPCPDCARGIIQAGITDVVGVKSDPSDPQWGDMMELSRLMLLEAGVKVRFIDWLEAPKAAS